MLGKPKLMNFSLSMALQEWTDQQTIQTQWIRMDSGMWWISRDHVIGIPL